MGRVDEKAMVYLYDKKRGVELVGIWARVWMQDGRYGSRTGCGDGRSDGRLTQMSAARKRCKTSLGRHREVEGARHGARGLERRDEAQEHRAHSGASRHHRA